MNLKQEGWMESENKQPMAFVGTSEVPVSLIPKSPPLRYNLGAKLQAIRVIGTGGMGTVLEVYHRELDARRAVKLVEQHILRESSQVFARFQREAVIASEMSHPNVVKVFDLDRTPDGSPFILMELLEGKNLEEVIRTSAPLPLPEVVRLLAGPADALDAVHRKGVIHRDLKPANLFLTHSGTVKILDFGISSFTVRPTDKPITRAGEVVGTPLYMAPEQLTGKKLSSAADVYALGMISYELLTGKPVFDCDDMHQLTTAILTGNPVSPRELNPALPAHVDRVFARVFHREPFQRYSCSLHFLRELAGGQYTRLISRVIRQELVSAIDSSEFQVASHRVQDTAASTDLEAAQTGVAGVSPDSTHDAENGKPDAVVEPERIAPTEKPGGIKWKRSPPWARVTGWTLVVLVLSLVAAFFALRHPQTGDGRVHVVFRAVTLDNRMDDAAWIRGAVQRQLRRYVLLDSNIVADSLSAGRRRSWPLPPDEPLAIRLSVARQQSDWRLNLQVAKENMPPLFEYTADASGYEAGIEEVTWALYRFLRNQSKETSGAISFSGEDHTEAIDSSDWVPMMFAALKNQALTPRVERLLKRVPDSPERTFFAALNGYVRCAVGESAETCLTRSPFPPLQPTSNADVNTLWAHFVNVSTHEKSCAIFSSPRQVVQGFLPILPGRSSCPTDTGGICRELNSFWQRYACARDSSARDMPGTALTYVFQGLKQDDAHSFYAALDVMFENGMNDTAGKKWLSRMTARYGVDNRELANLHFALAMAERHPETALIWARRAPAPSQKTALALFASGWLTEGIRKQIDQYQSLLENGMGTSSEKRNQALQLSLFPVVFTRDSMLAQRWLEKIAEVYPRDTAFNEATQLIQFIRDGASGKICQKRKITHFEVEADFLCGRTDRVIRRASITPQSAHQQGCSAFFLAEAYLNREKPRLAEELYRRMESEPWFRINYPVQSISSLKRLGDVARQASRTDEAMRWYRQYLAAWEALDIPTDDYMDAIQFVVKNEK